jgi:hypothetical protein
MDLLEQQHRTETEAHSLFKKDDRRTSKAALNTENPIYLHLQFETTDSRSADEFPLERRQPTPCDFLSDLKH